MHSFMHFSHLLLITGMAFSLARKILCRFLVILNAVKMQKKLCETISSGLFYHKSLILEKAKPSSGFLSPLYTQISDVTCILSFLVKSHSPLAKLICLPCLPHDVSLSRYGLFTPNREPSIFTVMFEEEGCVLSL